MGLPSFSSIINMNKLLSFAILLIFSNGIESATPHLNYRYSAFAVPNPNEAVEFLLKYISGFELQPEEILAKSLSSNPENSEIKGIRIPYNQGTTFADIYFIQEMVCQKIQNYHLKISSKDLNQCTL